MGLGGANSGPGQTDWLVLIGSAMSRVELILGQKDCHVPGALQGDLAALKIPESLNMFSRTLEEIPSRSVVILFALSIFQGDG